MPITFGSTIGIQAMSGKGERPELPLNEICLRAVNKYINNYDEARSLKESIENGTYDFETAIEDAASKIVENPEVLLWR